MDKTLLEALGNPHLKELDLTKNRDENYHDKDILELVKHCPNLESLKVDAHYLTDQALKYLCDLTKLKKLEIDFCYSLTDGIGIGYIGSMSQLTHLKLSGYEFLGPSFLQNISRLKNLIFLDLTYSEYIDVEDIKWLATLTQLKVFYPGTSLSDIGIKYLAPLNNLEELYTRGHLITDKSCEILASLTRLKVLELDGSSITDEGLKSLSVLTNIEVLYLDRCPGITNAGLKYIPSPGKLQRLHLAGNSSISDAGVAHLTRLRFLKALILDECPLITSEGLKFIAQLSNLMILKLNACYLIDKGGVQSITALKKLIVLHLNDCAFINDESLALLRSLPLQELEVARCPKISDKGLEYLSHMKNLEDLTLDGNTTITDQGLMHLVCLPLLQDLYIKDCNQLSREGIGKLPLSVKVHQGSPIF